MKRSIWVLLVVLVGGCYASAPPGMTPDELAAEMDRAASDGVVTVEEAKNLADKAHVVAHTETDWGTIIGGVLAAAATAILGVKIVPTRMLQGPFDRPKST